MRGNQLSHSSNMHSNTPPVASGQPGLPSQPAYTPVDMLPVTKVPALDTIDRYAVDKSVGAVVGKSPSVEVACSSSVRDLADSIIQGYARFISRFIGAEDVAFFVTRHAAFATGPDATRYAVCAFAVGSGDAATYTVHEFNEGQRDQNEVQFILELGLGSGPENGEAQQADTQEDVSAFPRRDAMVRATDQVLTWLEIRAFCPTHLIWHLTTPLFLSPETHSRCRRAAAVEHVECASGAIFAVAQFEDASSGAFDP